MSVHYEIHIDYETGSTFHTELITGESIGIVTRNLETAKENLRRIQKHYQDYEEDNLEDDEIFKLELLTDEEDGKSSRIICPFWCGYFEIMYGATIVPVDEDISFKT